MTVAAPPVSAVLGDHALPAGWRIASVGQLFDIQQGKALSAAARTAPERFPFLRTSNVLWGRIDLSTVDSMGMSPVERSRLRLRAGDLLVCEGGEIGRAAVWSGEVEECYYQNHIHRLRPRGDDIDPDFYAYWLQLAFTRLGVYEGVGTKTTIANLSRGRLAALEVPVPAFEEQRRIARILSTIQRATDTARTIDLRQRALAESLDNCLFAPSGGSEWPRYRLGDITVQRQYGLSVKGALDGTLPILRMTNLSQGVVSYESLQYIEPGSADCERYMLEPGDILFNRTNSPALVGRVGIVERSVPSVFASYLIRLVCDSSVVVPEFMNAFLNWEPTQARLRSMATRGVSQANISASTLATLEVPTPSLDVQLGISRAWKASRHSVDAALSEVKALVGIFDAAQSRLIGAVQ